jgi:hypothetical protein
LHFFITYGKVNNEDKKLIVILKAGVFMNNSKMLLLAVITMISSFSIIKAELSKEEEAKRNRKMEKAVKHAIGACHLNWPESYQPDNNHYFEEGYFQENEEVFVVLASGMSVNEIVPLIDKQFNKITKKAKRSDSVNCSGLVEHLMQMEHACKNAIEEGNGSITLFDLGMKIRQDGIGNKTLLQIVEQKLYTKETTLNTLKKQIEAGNGNLTLSEAHPLMYEEQVREIFKLIEQQEN